MTSRLFFGSPTKIFLALAAALLSSVAWAKDVAQVTLVVGQAQLERADGQQQVLERGAIIQESDRLRTGADGMVMLIFSDQGRVALRPDSELLIHKYQYDPEGQESDLQLELIKGTVRQISGKAAKHQPQRYRLSTPVAAIGVRGTDFLAQVDAGALRTYVHEGAIVLQGPLEREFLNRAGEGHRLTLKGTEHLQNQTLKLAELDSSFSIRLDGEDSTQLANASTPKPGGQLLAARSAVVQTDWVADGLQLSTPPVVVEPPAPLQEPTQLVWGALYENAQALPLTLLQTYATASNNRSVTVGQPQAYALWRDGHAGHFDKTLSGDASFALYAGEGYYSAASGAIQSAQLQDAKLDMNFDRSSFSTSMLLSSMGQSDALLQVDGRINSDGIFVGKTANQHVAGALSLDAKEAGYLFNVNAGAGGSYHGVTLWGQQPR